MNQSFLQTREAGWESAPFSVSLVAILNATSEILDLPVHYHATEVGLTLWQTLWVDLELRHADTHNLTSK
jgi:hypothetical protein